jgi:serine protease Do
LTPEIARYYDLPVKYGVLVTKVAEGSPAQNAQMQTGDIILEVDNREITRIEDLVAEIHKRKIGDIINIFALRDSRERFFELNLSQAP